MAYCFSWNHIIFIYMNLSLKFHRLSSLFFHRIIYCHSTQVHAWDDFSESNPIVCLHFLEFVYNEFLRPAFDMGWKGLIGEKIQAKSSSASQMMRYSSNLLGPVIGALQTILVETKGHHSPCGGYDPAHTNRMLGWANNHRSMISQLGDAGTILKAKLASLVRITSNFTIQDDIEEKEADLNDEDGNSQLSYYGIGFSREEAMIILEDCIDEWTSLAKHRRSALVKASRARGADDLAAAANQIVLCHKRLYKFGKDGTPDDAHRMIHLIYGKFLSPDLKFNLPNLATSTDFIGEKSLACNLIESIRYMYPKDSAGPHRSIKIERSVNYNLRRIGICPFACELRVKLEGLEGRRLEDFEQGEATQLHQSCVSLWKRAAVAYCSDGRSSDEAELVVLAGRLIIQHQRIQKTYSSGVNFSLSSTDETCAILDFAFDYFLSYGAEFGIDFARMHKTTVKQVIFSEPTNEEVDTSKEVYTSLPEGPYEIIISALQHLVEMGNDGLATKYYHNFCSAGTEDGEHKAYLDAELPFTVWLWPHPSAPTSTVWDTCPQEVRSNIHSYVTST